MKAVVLSLFVLVSTSCFAQNTVKTNYENGSVKSEHLEKGKLVAVTNYYESGEVKETGFFRNDVPEGRWETFSKDGSKTAELSYANGNRHGEFRVWDEFSSAYIEMKYANGEVITANRYLKETQFAATDK
ncbi:MAG: antitoxin component YwqK of YwqJK toxin-antitoxin module [Bacteroidia bacterium]|jgi:antitoxin component YwqK of YwqJK toxin-antitoxin module